MTRSKIPAISTVVSDLMRGHVALYFVASPLQYLAARRIAERHEQGARQVLVWYKRAVAAVVRAEDWDASSYMPWPRFEPLPGWFGRHRRLLENIKLVAKLVGKCDTLHIHSAVFDTEAINYFLHALPPRCGAGITRARILPDGLISIRRYPLSPIKRAGQRLRSLRTVLTPELRYWRFAGDRIGSDAPFCDRIYVLPGLPHEYPIDKVVVLPPLVEPRAADSNGTQPRALVIGQPLVGAGLMEARDRDAVAERIRAWLQREGIREIHYKGHPKDPHRELCDSSYRVLELNEPLELYMSHAWYNVVVGVRSSALLFARQLYDRSTRVIAFGWEDVKFKSKQEEADMRNAFRACEVEFE
ncbi:MAG TPA: hypothetical protein VFB54_15445 [Burkholderiales bacterium]|nr:hypothetical protein [Burkholderiales bacterium]